MKAKLSLLIPLLTIVGLVACTAAIPVSSTSTTVATTSTTTTTVAASPIPILVDANGVEIGYRAGIDEIYVPSIKRVIIYAASQSGDVSASLIWFATTDCSGTGYTPSEGVSGYGQPKLYARNSYKGLFTVADDTASAIMNPPSGLTPDGVCQQMNEASRYFSEVSYVSVAFSIPLVYPLKFK